MNQLHLPNNYYCTHLMEGKTDTLMLPDSVIPLGSRRTGSHILNYYYLGVKSPLPLSLTPNMPSGLFWYPAGLSAKGNMNMHEIAADLKQNVYPQVEKEYLNIKCICISNYSVIFLSSRFTIRLKGQVRYSALLSFNCWKRKRKSQGVFFTCIGSNSHFPGPYTWTCGW